MKFIKIIVCFISFSMLFLACSKPSMDDDARKAAELSGLSTQRAVDNDWSTSNKYYQEAQEIIDKYRDSDKFEEFYTLYNNYLELSISESMMSDQKDDTLK